MLRRKCNVVVILLVLMKIVLQGCCRGRGRRLVLDAVHRVPRVEDKAGKASSPVVHELKVKNYIEMYTIYI